MILLDKKRIDRTLKRMAFQIVEAAAGSSICLIGLNERGYAVAKQMQPIIESSVNGNVPLHQLDVNHNNDNHSKLSLDSEKESILVLVDDVIFSGSTMFRAVQNISERSQFKKIYIAVLVDRGHRKYPLYAGIVGIHSPTKLNEEVELKIEKGNPDEVILIEK